MSEYVEVPAHFGFASWPGGSGSFPNRAAAMYHKQGVVHITREEPNSAKYPNGLCGSRAKQWETEAAFADRPCRDCIRRLDEQRQRRESAGEAASPAGERTKSQSEEAT